MMQNSPTFLMLWKNVCPKKMDISGTLLTIKIPPVKLLPETPCKRCGRVGHYSFTCYVKTDVNGKKIREEEGYHSDGHP